MTTSRAPATASARDEAPGRSPMPGPVDSGRGVAVQRTTVSTDGPEATHELGAALAAVAGPGDRIALLGDLGAGKTQLAKGFAVGLGVTEVVNSPSFTLMAEYEGRLPLFHIDLYRLEGAESALAGGLLDERQADGVTLSEWAERLGDAIDRERLEIRFTIGEDDRRTLEVWATSGRYARYVAVAAAWAASAAGSASSASAAGSASAG